MHPFRITSFPPREKAAFNARRHVSAVLLLAAVVFMNTPAFTFADTLPKGAPPAKLFRISHTSLSKPELIALVSIQGILAKDSTENIYLDNGLAGYKHWLEILKTTHGTQVEDAESCSALVAHFAKKAAGYLLCRADDQRSLAIAGTLAGPLRAIIIDESLQLFAASLGLKQLHDTRDKDYAWLDHVIAFAPGANSTAASVIVSQPPGQVWQARDYAILANAQVVPAPSSAKDNPADESEARIATLASRLARTGAASLILGWGNSEKEDEQTFIGRVSHLGLPLVPADHVRNLSVLSSLPMPPGGLKQKKNSTNDATPRSKHTVTFVLSDGDNMSWLLFDCPANARWFGSRARGQVPLGWGMAPALAELAPGVVQWYYDQAAASPARDHFVAGPSGNGYFYPSLMPSGALAAHCTELNRLMGLSDMRLVQIIDNDAFERTDLWDSYLSQPNIDGLIYFDYAPYDKYRGRITWARGKPVVSAAMQLWGSGNHASTPAKPSRNSPEAIAARLNKAPRDPHSEKGYSLVVVHVWTHTVADVAALAARLDPGVEAVAPDEFFRRIQQCLGEKMKSQTPSPKSKNTNQPHS